MVVLRPRLTYARNPSQPKAYMTTFQELGLSEPTLAALAAKGFESPTPIQERTIPLLLAGNIDIVGQARTGTGKSYNFV